MRLEERVLALMLRMELLASLRRSRPWAWVRVGPVITAAVVGLLNYYGDPEITLVVNFIVFFDWNSLSALLLLL